MEHHASPRDRPGPGTGDRMAEAARDALAGLHGAPREPSSTRSPGVGLLFESEVIEPWDPLSPDAADDLAVDPVDDAPASFHIWNPFRTARRPATGQRADRPTISHLHTRRSDAGVLAIATLAYRGRLAHGTATADRDSTLRAVADATVAALGVFAGAPLRTTVVEVHRSEVGAPATVTVGIRSAVADERLVGSATVDGDPERAVMRAILEALRPCLATLLAPGAPTER